MADGRVIHERTVVTRTEHRCKACGSTYFPGTMMDVTTSTDEGRLVNFYWCRCCREFMSLMDAVDLEFGFDHDIWDTAGYPEFRVQWEQAGELLIQTLRYADPDGPCGNPYCEH